VFGILNVTPDSFSDGGRYDSVAAAHERARALVRDGADVIDVGGESTRPGATPVRPLVEQRRVVPVIERLVEDGIPVSVDTRNSATARLALAAGARYVNDVSGGEADPRTVPLVVESGAEYIAMRWGGGADAAPRPGPVAETVLQALRATTRRLVGCGMAPDRLILDPGLGFGMSAVQGWELIGALRSLCEIGPRILVGHSRKRFIGALLPEGSPAGERDAASAAVSVLCDVAGVWGVRVHSARATRRLLHTTHENAKESRMTVPALAPRQPGHL